MLKTSLATELLGILCCASVLQGCANMDAVGQFAHGAQALSDASAQFYDMTLESDRQLAMLGVDLGAAENSPKCRTQDGSFLPPWACATRGENLLSETRRNRAAVAALAQYAQSLNDIATFDDDAKVEKAAQELSGNLNHAAKTLDIAANTQESALANAISGLAKVYIDLKAQNVVHNKAKQAQEHVAVIIQTLKNDIKRQQQRLAVARLNAKATREEWFNAFRKGYQAVDASVTTKAALSIAAGHLVEDELVDVLAEEPGKLFLEDLERTTDSCLQAHIAIQDPDLKDKANNVGHFVNDAKNLLSSARRLTQ
ncbi:MAG: hypothetical protein LUQ11_14975 [Methylococcaceae bacterium]|nr:hypothetical protein [Methylococcaceae bacterium]